MIDDNTSQRKFQVIFETSIIYAVRALIRMS